MLGRCLAAHGPTVRLTALSRLLGVYPLLSLPARLLRLAVPAALVAGGLVALTGSSGSAAEPGPYRPKFTAYQNTAKAEYEPNAVMVKFKKKATTSARKAAVSKFGATAEQSVTSSVVRLAGTLAAPDLLKKVKADPTVELASLNYKRRISAVPNDEWYGEDQAAYLNTVRVPQAWDLSKSTGNQVVAAAGNDGSDVVQFPASYPEVIAVAATNAGGTLTGFSSYGDWVDLAAPGWDILSTGVRSMTPAGYDPYWYCTGTSCSAPIVAGVAALVKNKWPTLTSAQVATRLKVLSRDAGPRGTDPYYGAGILDAYAALGGKWTTDFAQGVADKNDQPARAGELIAGVAVSSTISVEGDVDWYKLPTDYAHQVRIDVTGPMFDSGSYAQNFGPVVSAYDENLKPLAFVQKPAPPVDSDGYEIPQALTASTYVTVPAGPIYVAVRNANGSRDSRAYSLKVTNADGNVGTAPIDAYPVRDIQPGNLSSNVPVNSNVVITFARDVDADSLSAGGLWVRNAKTGAVVDMEISYDPATRQAVLKPITTWPEATPMLITATGLLESGRVVPVAPFTSVFSTADLVPQPVELSGTGAYLAANLSWKLPPTPDLDQVIVRRNVGSKAPTISTGTLVYAGTGTAVKNTGLAQGTTYTYAAWVKDRTGHYSTPAVKQLLGMKSGIATTSTLINYGSSITIKGSTLRIDNVRYSQLPVNVYVRPKNSSKFTLLAAMQTSGLGTFSLTHKPLVSSVYMLTFPGNANLMGTRTPDLTVQVRPTISATLSPASIRLGGTTAFSGYVAPAHAGQTVYLQQYGNKVWKSFTVNKILTIS